MPDDFFKDEKILDFIRSCIVACDQAAIWKFGEGKVRIVIIAEEDGMIRALGNDSPKKCRSMVQETLNVIFTDAIIEASKN